MVREMLPTAMKHPFPRLRWAAAVWLVVWAAAYARVWGLPNFLHLCDVAVILTCVGIWRGSALLLSSQALTSLLIDAAWGADVLFRLVSGRHLVGGTEYMFQPEFPLAVRLLSLFHLAWPVLLVVTLRRVGYDRRAFALQAAIAALVLPLSRLAGPALNVNYAFRDPIWSRQLGPAPLHLLVIFAALVALIHGPTHLVLARLAPGRATASRDGG